MRNATSKKASSVKKNNAIFILSMITLPLIHFVVFSIYVNIDSFVMAFQKIDVKTNEVVWAGWENFERFFFEWTLEGNNWGRTIVNSVLYFPICSVLMLPLSVVAGYFLYRKIWLNGFFKIVFFLPSLISIVVLGIVFRSMFSTRSGPVNYILTEWFHVAADKIPVWLSDKNTAMPLLYLYAIWAGIGYNVVLIFGAMKRVPFEIVESARMDGIGTAREIFQIFVPIVWPTLSTLIVFGAMTIFQQYIQPMVLTPNNPYTNTIAYSIVGKVKNGSMYYAAALGLMTMLVALPIVQLIKWGVNKMYDVVEV